MSVQIHSVSVGGSTFFRSQLRREVERGRLKRGTPISATWEDGRQAACIAEQVQELRHLFDMMTSDAVPAAFARPAISGETGKSDEGVAAPPRRSPLASVPPTGAASEEHRRGELRDSLTAAVIALAEKVDSLAAELGSSSDVQQRQIALLGHHVETALSRTDPAPDVMRRLDAKLQPLTERIGRLEEAIGRFRQADPPPAAAARPRQAPASGIMPVAWADAPQLSSEAARPARSRQDAVRPAHQPKVGAAPPSPIVVPAPDRAHAASIPAQAAAPPPTPMPAWIRPYLELIESGGSVRQFSRFFSAFSGVWGIGAVGGQLVASTYTGDDPNEYAVALQVGSAFLVVPTYEYVSVFATAFVTAVQNPEAIRTLFELQVTGTRQLQLEAPAQVRVDDGGPVQLVTRGRLAGLAA